MWNNAENVDKSDRALKCDQKTNLVHAILLKDSIRKIRVLTALKSCLNFVHFYISALIARQKNQFSNFSTFSLFNF